MRCHDRFVSRADRHALGIEMVSGRPYLSIPMANRLVDYDEHDLLSPDEAEPFAREPEAARRFADARRARQHDDRLLMPPGRDRGTAV
ncbi:hypothetical protein [Burkholderia plantarii]|uniref:hypothetical protein n=1 Tax=Burkholderia plantarii TaxID=41899 RepID=UPI0018DDE7F2|nr:hypothetical protein [Burkholderia plantarii]MBI0330936.1 hypothetical protein [Burkholderia plantarii]